MALVLQLSHVLSLGSASSLQLWPSTEGRIKGCDYCSVEATMLDGSDKNKEQLQKAFNPSNFASSDLVYIYYIINTGKLLPPACTQAQFQKKYLPLSKDAIGLTGNGSVTLMVWTSTPVHMLVPPFAIQEFGLCSFQLSLQNIATRIPLYGPRSACILVENQGCSSGEEEGPMEQLTVRVSICNVPSQCIHNEFSHAHTRTHTHTHARTHARMHARTHTHARIWLILVIVNC